MTKGITGKEPDPMEVYGDIINHPHWQSPTRPHMSLYDRAAQFAPFAALTGYDEMIGEESRLVDNKIELSPDDMAVLNENLSKLQAMIENGSKPQITVTYFIPDPLKAGGRYETSIETVKRIDLVSKKLILERKVGIAGSNAEIKIEDILEIYSDELIYTEDENVF